MPTMGWTMFSVEDIVVNPTESLPSVNCCSGQGGRGRAQDPAGNNQQITVTMPVWNHWILGQIITSLGLGFFISKLKKLTR